MLDRCALCAPLLVLSVASTLGLAACGRGADEKPTEAKPTESTKAPLDEAKEPTKVDTKSVEEPKPDADAADVGGDAAEGVEPAAPEEGGEEAGAQDDPAAEGGEAVEGGEADAAEGGEPEDGEEAEGAAEEGADTSGKDSAALIKEARTTKTTDERALEALTEAETAGATLKELARAAKARGDYLYKDPDRAKVFYEWSAAKDEDYPDPVFALAKQKAVTGDLEDVVKLLKQVSERKGGKTLLEQIDFDPTWDIVKDDPEVRALL